MKRKRNPGSYLTLVLCGAAGIAGCASSSDFRQLTPSVALAPVEANGFSVMPPKGPSWFYEAGGDGVQFGRELASEPAPDPSAELAQTGLVVVGFMPRSMMTVASTADLQREATRWIKEMSLEPRERLVDFKVAPYTAQGTGCVRFEETVEDPSHPHARGVILITSSAGFFCRHPYAPDRVIQGGYSERRFGGLSPLPGETFKSEAEAVLKGVIFKPLK